MNLLAQNSEVIQNLTNNRMLEKYPEKVVVLSTFGYCMIKFSYIQDRMQYFFFRKSINFKRVFDFTRGTRFLCM